MTLIKCNECGTEMSDTAKACPKCGFKAPKTKWWLWIPLGLIAAFMGFGMISANSPGGQERSRDRAAIDMCWTESKRPSLDPATQRFAAGACEMMERKYTEKHGRAP